MKYKQSNALLELYWFYIFTKGNFSNICYLLTSKKKKKDVGKKCVISFVTCMQPANDQHTSQLVALYTLGV